MKAYWKGKRLGGYPGLKHTADKIAKYYPDNYSIYVEPFAGMGRNAEYVPKDKFMVLNDMGGFAVGHLRIKFPEATVTQEQFLDCIKKWDSDKTFFLIDPPYYKEIYDDNHSSGNRNGAFIDRSPKQYYLDLMEIVPKLLGNWIICGSPNTPEYKLVQKYGYQPLLVASDKKVIFGKMARTFIISNHWRI